MFGDVRRDLNQSAYQERLSGNPAGYHQTYSVSNSTQPYNGSVPTPSQTPLYPPSISSYPSAHTYSPSYRSSSYNYPEPGSNISLGYGRPGLHVPYRYQPIHLVGLAILLPLFLLAAVPELLPVAVFLGGAAALITLSCCALGCIPIRRQKLENNLFDETN